MNKKTIILILLLISTALLINLVNALPSRSNPINPTDVTYEIKTDSNFFGQPENQELVSLPEDYQEELMIKGFNKVGETQNLILYYKSRNFNIAIYDKESGYLWYSVYPEYTSQFLVGTSKFFVESGVVIEYYNMDNILIDDSKSYLSGSKYNVDCTYDLDAIENGLVAHLEFEDLGISFNVEVSIDSDKLIVHLPMESLVEEDIEKNVLNLDGTTDVERKQYKLKSVYLFPYFGSNNYEINGYSMIPDGSGALIRYTDNSSATAYTKRLYGQDEGVLKYNDKDSTYYLHDELTATLPVFGVNHGYHQAAFLAVVSEGDAFTEIHSYPYGYNSYEMDTTFAKFIVRERYTINTSSNEGDSFQMINEEPYPTDYKVEYYFLSNTDASYSGMASKYRNILDLDKESRLNSVNITLIGMDYKNGLFGKDFVEMTTYQDAIDIISELNEAELDNMSIIYQAWNKGGYYDNSTVKPVIANHLGGKADFLEMLEYLATLDVDIALYSNPLISFNNNLGSKVVKKLTLSSFVTNDVTSSIFDKTYFRDPSQIADTILNHQTYYSTYGLDSFVFDSVGDNLFSYRYNSQNNYRNQVIDILQAELLDLSGYKLGLYQPNAYLWKYIDSYHGAPIESNKYAYITDSIPFIELVLFGHTNMYSTYMNYVSDYEVMKLRMIEYGITPSFLITEESTHLLRYTNSEFIYTSEFDKWKELIISTSKDVYESLELVSGAHMVSHRYIATGVSEIIYDNGVKIYVNYQDEIFENSTVSVAGKSYEVIDS